MSRAIIHNNYRIEVYPRNVGDGGWIKMSERLIEPDDAKRNAIYKQECELLIPQIKRHVDGIGSVTVVFDTEEHCSFCGGNWTEKSETYNGGCCDEDEANNPEPVEAA